MERHGGSGLTFIIVPDEFTVGRAGPWLAMLNDACQENYKAVAVEFDTRQNPEFGDPSDNHVGINLGSIVSTAVINASEVGVSLKDSSVHRAWISYDGHHRWMDIRLGYDEADRDYYPPKALFAGRLDLSSFLNEYMFVGFSASTGNMTQIHSILSWNFTASSQAALRIPSSETCESKLVREVDYGHLSQHKAKANPIPLRSIFIFVGVSTFVLLGFIICFLFNKRSRRVGKSKSTEERKVNKKPRPPNKPRRFSLSEISFATRGFSELVMLGSDSRGVFYRGKLSNGCQVAIKRFSEQFLTSHGVDRRRLLKEIAAISRVRHPNLVPIQGWCHDNREVIVVYDFCINGSLNKWVFGVGVLPWSRRLKVIRDVAEALSFLHSKQHSHKNVKPTSVFLDISFRAALGDLGFVLSGVESRRFESAVSQTTDVFEFGIFVLEVVSGRRRLEMEGKEVSKEEKDLVDFAWRMHERDEKTKVVDRRMGSLVNLEQAVRVLEIGLLCTLNEGKGRPCMAEVVEFLSLGKKLPELPASRPMALFPYNSTTGLCTGYSCSPFN